MKNSLYEIIFLSDNVQERIDFLEKKYSFLHKFNAWVFSHIAKTRKPDPVIYELALAEAINSSHECVYIDDKEELLEPAKALGMSTIHFKHPEQLEKELKKLWLTF